MNLPDVSTSHAFAGHSYCMGAQCMPTILTERFLRRALIVIALGGLIIGLFSWGIGRDELAWWAWAAGTAPVVVGLLISMIRDFLAGRMGVDAVDRLLVVAPRNAPVRNE